MHITHEHNSGHPLDDPIDESYTSVCSYAQERLWFLDQLFGASGLYNLPWAIHIKGDLDVIDLQRSLNAIVARHAVLRTYFIEQESGPVQVIRSSIPSICALMDLTALPQEHRDNEIQHLLDTEANKVFDLKQAPLIRALLLVLSKHEHILLVTLHHIVSDGWSMGVFWQELASFYCAFRQGQAANLPELPIQYKDYAAWQRERLQGETLERQLNYWKTQLANLTVLELPTDKLRPKLESYRSAQESIHLSATLSRSLKAFSQQQNVTLFMALLAVFQVLLHRYTGQDDIVVGTEITGRNRQDIESLIGHFVNTLAIRTDLSGSPSFNQLLSRVREACLGAYAHQDIPFEKLLAKMQVQRDMARHPMFQVMLVLQTLIMPDPQLQGLAINKVTMGNRPIKFDLLVSFEEHADGLRGTIEYSTDLFNPETIARLAGHFKTLLESVVEHQETAISELPLLTEPERHQLLVEWNATQTDYPKDKCVPQLFEEWVEKTPDAIALVYEDQQLNYQTLSAKANQLAHYLQTKGVKPDTLVAICLERSFDLVIGLLAILKAGGAYVPLDPTYPQERLAFILEDTKAPVLLKHSSMATLLPVYSGLLICLDKCQTDINRESTENPRSSITSEHLAYIIYTSGSTGKPKGVEVCHYNITRLLINNPYARFDNKQHFLLLAPPAFDASTFEIWGGLLHGARAVIYPERIPTLDGLKKIIKEQCISTLWLTTSLFNVIIDEQPLALSTVTQILTGGEALSTGHIRRALKLLPDSQIINGYGPTESTTFACCYPIPKTISPQATSIPIGRPIANTQIYILDKHLQLAPIGVPGEIHIGGDGLARGYLNSPELTAEKFITHPFSDDAQARLYKTGDLARYLPDGAIEFLGRRDHQIKLRGFRIELGEIESVLGQHPDINGAFVTVRENKSGDKRLVAYLTHPQHAPPNVSALRLFLTEKLPEYMVPSAYVILDKFPLTPNGKIDQKALPAPPDKIYPEFEQAHVAPRSPIEEMLAVLWREVLKIDPIGVHDNFFELGGYSLQAIVLCTKIQAKIGKPVPVEWIFQFPTINLLADAISTHTDSESNAFNPIITAFQNKGTRPPFFWGLQGGHIVVVMLECLDKDQPLYLLNHQALDGTRARHVTIPDLANLYLQNIIKVDPDGPYYLGGYSIGGMIMYEVAQQLCTQGKKVALLFLVDQTSIGYDETEGDLIRQKVTFREEYNKFKSQGCLPYLKSHLREILIPIIIKTCFSLGIALPLRFHWFYMLSIYRPAIRRYHPKHPMAGIQEAIMVHISQRTMEDWINLFNGKIKTHAIDCSHMQLLEPPYNSIWLKILKQAISESVGKRL